MCIIYFLYILITFWLDSLYYFFLPHLFGSRNFSQTNLEKIFPLGGASSPFANLALYVSLNREMLGEMLGAKKHGGTVWEVDGE